MENFCILVPELLTPSECQHWIQWGNAGKYQQMSSQYPPSYRDNDRLMFDSEELAAELLTRLESKIPKTLQRDGQRWYLRGLNPRFRGCRYRQGQSFTRHRDGAFSPNPRRRSLLTVMLYLNPQSEFEGGATRFFSDRYCEEAERTVEAREGQAIVFSHDYWHDGESVSGGTKYVLRSDIIYELDPKSPTPQGHRGYVWALLSLADGRLASASRDGTIRVWSKTHRSHALSGHSGSITSLARWNSGFCSGGRDGHILTWVASGDSFRCREKWEAHQGVVLNLLDLTPEERLSSGADGFLRLWGPAGLELSAMNLGSWVWGLCLSHTHHLWAGTEEGGLHQVSRDLKESRRVQDFESPIRALTPYRGGLACGLADSSIHILDSQGHRLGKLQGHRGAITSLLTLDNGLLVSGAEDDGVRIWSQRASSVVQEHRDFVRALCKTTEGDLVSASYDGKLRFSRPSTMDFTAQKACPSGTSSGTVAASW